MATSIKSNLVFNGINTATGILFPLITFPYVTRVLLPEGFGTVNFLISIINVITLFTTLGIPLYAVKQIARYREDPAMRDKNTAEIISLAAMLAALGYVAVFVLAAFVPEISRSRMLFYVLSLSIFFGAIGVEWFYQGIENFRFITIRALIVRVLSTAAVFIFVKTPSDILIYGLIYVGATVGNNIINFGNLFRIVDFRGAFGQGVKILRHIKPILALFLIGFIVSLYAQLNPMILGFIAGEESVGYYIGGTKIVTVCVSLIISQSAVFLSRCTSMYHQNDIEGFGAVINKSLRLTCGLALPIATGAIVLAPVIITVMCGPDYEPSVRVLAINAPVILFGGITNVLGIQTLYVVDRVKVVIASVSTGAVLNLLLNLLLVQPFAEVGSVISVTVSEVVVAAMLYVLGRRYIPFKIRLGWAKVYVLASLAMGMVVYLVSTAVDNSVMSLVVAISVGAAVYVLVLALARDSLLTEMLSLVTRYLKKSGRR